MSNYFIRVECYTSRSKERGVMHMKNKSLQKRIIQIVVIIAILIIPLLYSYFYLGAFWDPYSRLETLPVAVVNLDQGAMIDEEERNVGQELCDNLEEEDALKFIFTDEQDAKAGTMDDAYYAMIVIPENFSKSIASASTDEKVNATITFSPNQKKNFLASQILSKAMTEVEETLRGNVNGEIVQQLADNIEAVPDQMVELSDGIDQLNDGVSDLSEGANTLSEGANKLNDKFGDFQQGISNVTDGTESLQGGIDSLETGLGNLLAGVNQVEESTENIGQLSDGAETLASGAQAFNKSLTSYIDGVDSLISTISDTSTFLQTYVTEVNPKIMQDAVFAEFMANMASQENAIKLQTLQGASSQLKSASEQIAAGAEALNKGSQSLPELKEAISILSAGLTKVKVGAMGLSEGASSLYDGMNSLTEAADKISLATEDLAEGSTKLSDGIITLQEGVSEANDGLSEAIEDTNDQLNTLDGLAEYAKEPVTIEETDINYVPNYGTAFAPYFLSLSLWVGALIIFVGIYLDTESKFKILSRDSNNKIARSFLYLLIGLGQAILLAFIIEHGLGLEVENTALYYVSCCLVSIVFLSIIQFFMVHFKDAGKFVSIVLLILQLTSCGGTFPMETVPDFFNVLYPFMPMTYSVGLFKQAISGVETDKVVSNSLVLSAILIVFMVLTIGLSIWKKDKADKISSVAEV